MKNRIKTLMMMLAILMLLPGINASGQKVVTAFELSKMNVLYLGVDNPLTVACSETFDSIYISNGSIVNEVSYSKGGEFTIKPANTGTATISIFRQGKLVASQLFRVKRVPSPVARLSGITGESATKGELIAASGLNVVLENFDFEMMFKVVSFTMTINSGGSLLEMTASNSSLTDTQKKAITNAVAGDKIYFEDIKVKGTDGIIRTLMPISLKVK